jgi:hypothetical protein
VFIVVIQRSPAPVNDIISIDGNTLFLKIGEYRLFLKIEGPEVKPATRLQLQPGQTLFDLILEAAQTFIKGSGEKEFTAADLYHIVREKHPDLDIRRNSWNSHMMSSAPNHPSYKHYTSHRDYFRYLGKGKYSLESKWSTNNTSNR